MKENNTDASISTEEIIPSHEINKNTKLFLDTENLNKMESNEEIQIEQEKVKIDLLNLDISLTNASDVLRTMNISDKDNYR